MQNSGCRRPGLDSTDQRFIVVSAGRLRLLSTHTSVVKLIQIQSDPVCIVCINQWLEKMYFFKEAC